MLTWLLSASLVQVLDLHRCHIDHIQVRLRAQTAHQELSQVAVDTGHLQHLAVNHITHFLQGQVAQPREIAPQESG
jgi:hypothetical protein